ncbi:hypothetical protein PFTANZ_06505, partial [Plasmodium falciparum Tanzania (2000708)]
MAKKENEKAEEKDPECGTVNRILKGDHGNSKVGDCKPKTEGPYPDWKSGDKSLVDDDNVFMPPRRQKLCLFYVADTNEKNKIDNQDDLRDGFIRTAAAETFLAWYYYKSKHSNGKELEEKLKEGEIPPEFFRSMFYTYGDYRDIFFDTDISAKTDKSHVKSATDFIRNFFSNDGSKSPGNLSRENWWQTNSPKIWKGMLCGLSHVFSGNDKETARTQLTTKYTYSTVKFSGDNTTSLEEFAKRPQFLRWMTEWGEHFCREHKVEKGKLAAKCGDCAVDPDDGSKCDGECGECQEQCQAYKRWIKTWQDNYKKQKQRYTEVKDNPQYNNDNDVLGTTHAY